MHLILCPTYPYNASDGFLSQICSLIPVFFSVFLQYPKYPRDFAHAAVYAWNYLGSRLLPHFLQVSDQMSLNHSSFSYLPHRKEQFSTPPSQTLFPSCLLIFSSIENSITWHMAYYAFICILCVFPQ